MKVPFLDLKRQYGVIKKEMDDAVFSVLSNTQFILGPEVKSLEEKIASYCRTKFAIGVASGTDALLLSLRACGVKSGDEVITTGFSFFASAGVISRLGANPIFVDIDPETYNINPDQIEKKVTPKTKTIMPVHLFGQCADMDPIMEVARKHSLKVIEDAAQAIGAEYKGKKAGAIGDFGCFSFFPSKNLGGAGDGGMVVTNDPEIAEMVRILRAHGAKPKYYHSTIGYNSRLDTLQAAILSVKLKYLDDWTKKRREHAEVYNSAFTDL
ncbi:MAG: DegT/DnrJ/EryC1/StrS family aminotransferase, partial [candidate division Zixibacteria bacterium]|nr:DegT/DnrJ/EryC1/StrS family aminotransferase [candidate division Zixibacteria bacterium]